MPAWRGMPGLPSRYRVRCWAAISRLLGTARGAVRHCQFGLTAKIGGAPRVLEGMGRDIRYLPSSGALVGTLVEVTVRTIQQRYLLRPRPRLNQLVVGVLGHAQEATGMRVHAVVAMR